MPYYRKHQKIKYLIPVFFCLFSFKSMGQSRSYDIYVRNEKSAPEYRLRSQIAFSRKLFEIAKKAPDSIGMKASSIAEYFVKQTDKPQELVLLFVYWIGENISYDVDKHLSSDRTHTKVAETLETRKTMCQGYSELLWELCSWAEIGCETISGYSKGYGYNGEAFEETNHVWNAVLIDDKWELIDVTWASGYLSHKKGHLVFNKKFRQEYIFANPDFFILTHFPVDSDWQLIKNPLSKDEFLLNQQKQLK